MDRQTDFDFHLFSGRTSFFARPVRVGPILDFANVPCSVLSGSTIILYRQTATMVLSPLSLQYLHCLTSRSCRCEARVRHITCCAQTNYLAVLSRCIIAIRRAPQQQTRPFARTSIDVNSSGTRRTSYRFIGPLSKDSTRSDQTTRCAISYDNEIRDSVWHTHNVVTRSASSRDKIIYSYVLRFRSCVERDLL